MKYLSLLVMLLALVSCGSDSSGGGAAGVKTADIDVLDRVYRVFSNPSNEEVKKIEIFENDTMKITRDDDSTENFNVETRDEGFSDDNNLRLSAVCTGPTTVDPEEGDDRPVSVDLRLTESDGTTFAAILEAVVWEGTCSGQKVECVALLVHESDTAFENMNTATPDQGYIFDLNGAGGCSPIQSQIQTLLDDRFAP